MIEYAGTEFCLLTAGAFKKTVINDKGVDAVIAGERFNSISDLSGQQRCKAQPVRLRAVQEPVKSVL